MQGQYFFSQSHLKSFCSEIVSTDACSYPPNAFNHKSNNIFEMCKMVPQWSLICQNKKVWDSSIFFPPNLEKINFIYRPACSYNFQDGPTSCSGNNFCVSGSMVCAGFIHPSIHSFQQLFSNLSTDEMCCLAEMAIFLISGIFGLNNKNTIFTKDLIFVVVKTSYPTNGPEMKTG